MNSCVQRILFSISKLNFSNVTLPVQDFKYVPIHESPVDSDVQELKKFYEKHDKILVLTGAGISTESGIPDYRSEGVGLYQRSNHKPMFIQEFMKSPESRKRYWARNFVGWTKFSQTKPNEAHQIVRKWELAGKVKALVTQNVDRLHNKAGSKAIELHGTGYEVICVECREYREDRHVFQKVLMKYNPHFDPVKKADDVRPDGDIDLNPVEVNNFVLPPCPKCGKGILKPDIVFFGDNVPRDRVEKIYDLLSNCDAMLVLGSSLQVFSSYRFALRAKELGIPIGIISLGSTRADHLAMLKLGFRAGEIMKLVETALIHSKKALVYSS